MRLRSGLSRMVVCVFVCIGPPGCAVYREKPLPNDDELLAEVTMVRAMPGAPAPFDVADGLDIDEVAAIAVLNNPSLRATRTNLGVAQAQAFAAGLLPDPQITLGSDNPTNQTDTQVNAYTFSIDYDVGALITRSPTRAAADAATEQVRLDVVWQEWQVAQQTRIAWARYQGESRKLQILRVAHDQFNARADASANAMSSGDLTVDVAGSDLAALLDVDGRLFQLEIQHNDTAKEINALLGLAPEVVLQLVGTEVPQTWPPIVDTVTIAEHRPDLLALRAGYQSQEARLRAAIWRQFPALTIAFNRLRDTSDVWTSGFGATLSLPIFSGARGDIAVERATREKLRAEYQVRLAQTRADVTRLQSDAAITQAHLDAVRMHIPQLQTMAAQARQGYQMGDLDAVVSINLDAALVTSNIELIDLEQTLWETHIALDSLLGRETR